MEGISADIHAIYNPIGLLYVPFEARGAGVCKFQQAIRQIFFVGMSVSVLRLFLSVLFIVFPTLAVVDGGLTSVSDYVANAKRRFSEDFNRTCSKYPFVSTYHSIMSKQPDKYLIFGYREHGTNTGGFGDRLAGLITAFAYAIRTGRTFVVQSDEAFQHYFRPYPVHGLSADEQEKLSWDDLSWTKLHKRTNSSTSKDQSAEHVLHCINPNNEECALDHIDRYDTHRVLKYYSNRMYMCRWLVKGDSTLRDELQKSLGIARDADLFEVAGCLLRLVLHPTKQLWQAAEHLVKQQSDKVPKVISANASQIAVHFRSGDRKTFANGRNNGGGTHMSSGFSHHLSPDNTVDVAKCTRTIVDAMRRERESSKGAAQVVVYLESDSEGAARDILKHVDVAETFFPNSPCHIDNLPSSPEAVKATHECSLSTLAQWFVLSWSEYIVTQSTRAPLVEHLDFAKQEAPLSAFSRFAAIYGLHMDNMRYGRDCAPHDLHRLSHQTQGNWVCNPRQFYRL